MAVEFCGRDSKIAEVRARLRMLLVVIVQGCLHDDRLKRRPQRSSCQGSSRWCYAKFSDRKGSGVSKGCRDPHRGVRCPWLAAIEELADPLDDCRYLHAGSVPRTCGTHYLPGPCP